LSSTEREELLSHVDFSRVNEETMAACKTNKLIPQQLITDAALSLSVKLRRQLEETQNRLQLLENSLNKSRPSYISSSSSNIFIHFFLFLYLNNLFFIQNIVHVILIHHFERPIVLVVVI
jgi:hypothetical protein